MSGKRIKRPSCASCATAKQADVTSMRANNFEITPHLAKNRGEYCPEKRLRETCDCTSFIEQDSVPKGPRRRPTDTPEGHCYVRKEEEPRSGRPPSNNEFFR